MRDAVNPQHYKRGGTEVITFIREQLGDDGFVAYCRGNVMKYVARAGHKVGASASEDLEKAAQYCQWAAEVAR